MIRWLLAVLLLALPVQAVPVSFQVMPSGCEVSEGDRVVASAHDSQVTFDADPTVVHRYQIARPPYTRMSIVLEWNPGLKRWLLHSPQGTVDLMGQTRPLMLSRDIRVQAEPSDSVAYRAAPGGKTVNVDGQILSLIPLVRTPDGKVTVPFDTTDVYLLHSGFSPQRLSLHRGQLDGYADQLPLVKLWPLYGPFSYRTFDLSLAGLALAFGLPWLVFVVPRRRQQRRRAALESSIVRQLDSAADRTDIDLRKCVGAQLPTLGGEAYVLLDMLGRGGYGAVFAATTVEAQSPDWAVKLLLVPNDQQRFLREVRVCSRLSHPGIVKIVDWGFFEAGMKRPLPFIVFERLMGHTLRAELDARGGRADAATVVRWATEVLRALATAHDQGIVHRDLKPDNLMVLDSGHLKIMDFGIAREVDMSLTRTGEYVGTPLYMSPEQFTGRTLTPATDVYSLGVVMYQALSGSVPHDEDSVWALLAAMQAGKREPLLHRVPDLSPALAALVEKMLAYDVGERYASTGEVLKDIQALGDL